jgi:hypothetical protein
VRSTPTHPFFASYPPSPKVPLIWREDSLGGKPWLILGPGFDPLTGLNKCSIMIPCKPFVLPLISHPLPRSPIINFQSLCCSLPIFYYPEGAEGCPLKMGRVAVGRVGPIRSSVVPQINPTAWYLNMKEYRDEVVPHSFNCFSRTNTVCPFPTPSHLSPVPGFQHVRIALDLPASA